MGNHKKGVARERTLEVGHRAKANQHKSSKKRRNKSTS